MNMERDAECPRCGAPRTFWRVASTEVHLGEKVKWRCEECDYGLVRIDGAVNTA